MLQHALEHVGVVVHAELVRDRQQQGVRGRDGLVASELLDEPIAGPDAPALAEALLIVVSGDLAMRLREGAPADTSAARAVAEAVVDRWADRG